MTQVCPVSDADGVLAVYTSRWTPSLSGELITACWSNGMLIWSNDPNAGGAPYIQADTDPEAVTRVLSRLEADGLFDGLQVANGCRLGGGPYTNILIRYRGRVFHTMSDHEQYELDGTCVVEHGFIKPLMDRRRFQVLAQQPNIYLFSRFLWVELRSVISALLPRTGVDTQGRLHFKVYDHCEWIKEDAEP
ncbi:MAG: hypothetical protein AAGG48_31495 [Planctomycetota bacterium]